MNVSTAGFGGALALAAAVMTTESAGSVLGLGAEASAGAGAGSAEAAGLLCPPPKPVCEASASLMLPGAALPVVDSTPAWALLGALVKPLAVAAVREDRPVFVTVPFGSCTTGSAAALDAQPISYAWTVRRGGVTKTVCDEQQRRKPSRGKKRRTLRLVYKITLVFFERCFQRASGIQCRIARRNARAGTRVLAAKR